MRFVKSRLWSLRIPFQLPFVHSLKRREFSDSVVVAITTDSGVTGFGEGAPRPYVTGETSASCSDHIRKVLLPAIRPMELPDKCSKADFAVLLSSISNSLPATGNDAVIAFHAAKCAVELAIVDCLLQYYNIAAGEVWRAATTTVIYSAVIGAGPLAAVERLARQCREAQIKQVKVKVGDGDDFARVAAVRSILGDDASIRVDANGALDLAAAVSLAKAMEPLKVDCIEQPLPRGDISAWAELRRRSGMPLMADESLVTAEDADQLIEQQACDFFNLRISKNGGMCDTLGLAAKARHSGIGLQLGCQVGETSILSAAGRHLAAHLWDLRYVEGSYGPRLLEEDISEDAVSFGRGGAAPLLTGRGLGVTIREDLLAKHSGTVTETL